MCVHGSFARRFTGCADSKGARDCERNYSKREKAQLIVVFLSGVRTIAA